MARYRHTRFDEQVFGAATANTMPCAFWEYGPPAAPVAINNEGPSNMLMAQNQRDPSHRCAGGQLLDERFGNDPGFELSTAAAMAPMFWARTHGRRQLSRTTCQRCFSEAGQELSVN
jgi:hypothetical protein